MLLQIVSGETKPEYMGWLFYLVKYKYDEDRFLLNSFTFKLSGK